MQDVSCGVPVGLHQWRVSHMVGVGVARMSEKVKPKRKTGFRVVDVVGEDGNIKHTVSVMPGERLEVDGGVVE